jgi:hypothetical protein
MNWGPAASWQSEFAHKGNLMKMRVGESHSVRLGAAAFVVLATGSTVTGINALAQPMSVSGPPAQDRADDLKRLRSLIEQQSRRLDDQDRRLEEQEKTIKSLREEIDAHGVSHVTAGDQLDKPPLQTQSQPKAQVGYPALGAIRAAGLPPNVPLAVSPLAAPSGTVQNVPSRSAQNGSAAPVLVSQGNATPNAAEPNAALPSRPVGEAPAMPAPMSDVSALPEGARVLTPARALTVEGSVEYDRTSSHRLVFRGVEIVPGIQLGLVDANDVARDSVIGTVDLRYGIFDRAEIEVRVPYWHRNDRLTVLSQQVSATTPAVTQTTNLQGDHLGDIEFNTRYQLNRALQGGAIYVAGLRVKSATGIGPYDVDFDSNGIATELGTGSGFWAMGPSLTMLLPSDPVVIYANAGYLHNFSRNINKDIGTTHVGEARPGDSIDTSLGFGFALNPQFSVSLGVSNTYIFWSRVELGATNQRVNSLEAGSLTLGMSYTILPTLALSANFEFGVTSDAPDLRAIFRVPYRF